MISTTPNTHLVGSKDEKDTFLTTQLSTIQLLFLFLHGSAAADVALFPVTLAKRIWLCTVSGVESLL